MNLISIGELLWDVVGETEHLGGAPLNFAAHAAKFGHNSYLISAVGQDERGQRALSQIRSLGVNVDYISRLSAYPTGYVSVTIDRGQPRFTIHRPAAYEMASLTTDQIETLASLSPCWIYFGTLAQMSLPVRQTTLRIINAMPAAKRFYDVNLRKDCYTPEVVCELLQSATVVKLNDAEVRTVEDLLRDVHHRTIEEFCRKCLSRFGWEAVCVTRGEQGCELLVGEMYVESPAFKTELADAIGAGDAFAAALVHSLSLGWNASQAAAFANRLGSLVASRAGAIPHWTLQELDKFGDAPQRQSGLASISPAKSPAPTVIGFRNSS